MIGISLTILLVVLGVVVLPFWPYSKRWGYLPCMFVYVALVVVFMLWVIEVI
jgi:Protein of unknown function (DUF3309)